MTIEEFLIKKQAPEKNSLRKSKRMFSRKPDKKFSIETKKIVAAMEDNFLQKTTYFASCLPQYMEVLKINSVTLSNAKIPSDTFNIAIGGKLEKKNAEETIFAIAKHFDKLPMAWWFGPHSNYEPYQEILQKAGFSHKEHDIGMSMKLNTLPNNFEYSKDLKIQTVKNQKSLNDYAAVLTSIFSPPDRHIADYYSLVAKLNLNLERPMKLFLAYLEGQAVAISACYFSQQVTGVYDVCTLPKMQKRGFGSAMTYHALQTAKKSGYELAVLQASPEGINIYKRFGFTETCSFNVYGK